MEAKNTLLIAGTGRSGTTAFRKMVESHPDVCSVPEWRFMTDPCGLVEFLLIARSGNPFMQDQAFRRLQGFFQKIMDDSFPKRLTRKVLGDATVFGRRLTFPYANDVPEKILPGFNNLAHAFLEDLQVFTWKGQYAGTNFLQKNLNVFTGSDEQQLIRKIRWFTEAIEELAKRTYGKELFVDKNTWNICHFDLIEKFYKHPKLVHIIRDPRDVVASFINQPWMPDEVEKSAAMVLELHMQWEQAKRSLSDSSFIEVRFEDLLENKNDAFSKVLDFWKLDLNEAKVSLDSKRANIGRFSHEFSLAQQDELARKLEPILLQHGYIA